jgi:hypothetical protein
MIRRLGLLAIPTALVASGCASTQAWMPPSQAAQDWDMVPVPRPVVVPSLSDVGTHWLLPAQNPWAAYQKQTLVTALGVDARAAELPNVYELDVVQAAQEAARAVARVGLPRNTMWMLDLRGAASVAFGATLSTDSRQAVTPILTFNNWPAENEIVPAEETLSALVAMQPKLPSAEAAEAGQPVFLLDAWRLAYRNEVPDDEATDNRYMLTPADFPNAATLLSRRIDHVLYVVENLRTTTTEEDDLQETFLAYQRAGITVSMVDLGWLGGVDAPARWDERLRERLLTIDPERITVVNDPTFYIRAQGGFGGVHVFQGQGGHHTFHGGSGWGMGGHGGG